MTPADDRQTARLAPAPASQVEAGKAAPEPVAGGPSLLTAAAGAVLISVLIASLDETYEAVRRTTAWPGSTSRCSTGWWLTAPPA